MKSKKIFSLILVVLTTSLLFAQEVKMDNILLKDGTEIEGKVKEITGTEVKYVTLSMPDGPLRSVEKGKVFIIQYSNGTKEVINTVSSTPPAPNNSSVNSSSTTQVVNSYKGRASDDPNAKEYTLSDLRSSIPTMYYGIDFTNVKLVGSGGFKDPAHIVDNYFGSINRQIVVERSKFDFSRMFKTSGYDVDLGMLADVNRALNPYEIITNSNHRIDEEVVSNTVNNYNPEAQEGVGLVIIMETWNKLNNQGTMYFTLFDIKTKKVLETQRTVGICSGFGIRNFWMSPVYDSLDQWRDR